MKRLLYIFAIIAIVLGHPVYAPCAEVRFSHEPDAIMQINKMDLMPKFASATYSYQPKMLSALTQNVVTYGTQKHVFELDEIKKDEILDVYIDDIKYSISLRAPSMPDYTFEEINPVEDGLIYIAPFEGACAKQGYAYIVDTKGRLLFYRTNDSEFACVSDFKQTKLPDGSIVNTLFQQEQAVPPTAYLFGTLIVMDDQFNEIKRLNMLPHGDFNWPYIDNHHSIILGKDHYILSTYSRQEIHVPEKNSTALITATVIQEIKDGKVVFFWQSSDYPELISTCLSNCHFNHSMRSDYMHYNTIIIDPSDNNLIVSLAAQSSLIKIDRKTGKILWHMGGLADEFNIAPENTFIGQHAPNFMDKNEILLFDNQSISFSSKTHQRFSRTPATPSRLLRIKFNEQNKTADISKIELIARADTMGSAYPVPGGNFIVSYGSNMALSVQEINAAGSPHWNLALVHPFKTYRAYKYPKNIK